MDRAHRLGQTKQVTVYRLICKGTIEERILERAQEKSEIQRMVITGGNFRPDQLKPKEVVSLLLDDDEIENKFRQRQQERKGIEERHKMKDRKRKREKYKDVIIKKTKEDPSLGLLEQVIPAVEVGEDQSLDSSVPSPMSGVSVGSESTQLSISADVDMLNTTEDIFSPSPQLTSIPIADGEEDDGTGQQPVSMSKRNRARSRIKLGPNKKSAGRQARPRKGTVAAAIAGARAGAVAGTAAAYAAYGFSFTGVPDPSPPPPLSAGSSSPSLAAPASAVSSSSKSDENEKQKGDGVVQEEKKDEKVNSSSTLTSSSTQDPTKASESGQMPILMDNQGGSASNQSNQDESKHIDSSRPTKGLETSQAMITTRETTVSISEGGRMVEKLPKDSEQSQEIVRSAKKVMNIYKDTGSTSENVAKQVSDVQKGVRTRGGTEVFQTAVSQKVEDVKGDILQSANELDKNTGGLVGQGERSHGHISKGDKSKGNLKDINLQSTKMEMVPTAKSGTEHKS